MNDLLQSDGTFCNNGAFDCVVMRTFEYFAQVGKGRVRVMFEETKKLCSKKQEKKQKALSEVICCIKQIDSMLACVCPVIDRRGCQNVVRTSVTHTRL